MGASMELHTVNGHGSIDNKNCVDEVGKAPQVIKSEMPSADHRDAQALARLGKKPVLKVPASFSRCRSSMTVVGVLNDPQRRFSFIAMLGFTCTVLVTWEVIPM